MSAALHPNRELTVADELLFASLPDETKAVISVMFDDFMRRRDEFERNENQQWHKGYDQGMMEGRLEAVLTEQKDLATLLNKIKSALKATSPSATAGFLMETIKEAVTEFEEKVVA